MEAFERGDLTPDHTGGNEIAWGDMESIVHRILPAIASQKDKLGRLLGQGSVAAALKINNNADTYTAHSKGLEAPMHDPRGGGHGLALAYAVSPRGGCHVATSMLAMESGACYYPEINFEYELDPMTAENKAEAAVTAVELGSIENSACYCQFAGREISIPQWVELFNAVAGYGWDIRQMMRAGRRIFYLKRLINYSYGRTAKDDVLSPRMLEAARDGEPEGVEMDFAEMKTRFYELISMDAEKGIPLKEVLEKYDMSEEAKRIW
jgi:aldehyde:ferredoxin oxidoreductase